MFHDMRRKAQALSPEESIQILTEGSSGVLALAAQPQEEYPYAVPLSYVYGDGKIWFHCASSGHKLELIRQNPRASFCVVGMDKVVPEEYTTFYRSVIAFGRIRMLEDEQEKCRAIERLMVKYAPEDDAAHRSSIIRKSLGGLCMLELEIERLTGKEAIELTRARSGR